MSAYQFLNPAPVLFTINGIDPVDGGSLSFYDEGTTSERDTWSNPDLVSPGHLNPNPVPLDAAGRSESAIWLDGNYTVVLRDSFGDEVWSRVVRSDVTGSLAIPALAPGFLTNDLSNLLWQDLLLIPDPTGSTNYILSTDGANIFWIPQPEAPEPPTPQYQVGEDFLRIGTYLRQWGSGTAPAAPSAKTSSVNVTFAHEFVGLADFAGITISNAGGSTPSGAICTYAVTNLTATGMTVTVNMPDDDSNSSWKLSNSTPFRYVVEGPCLNEDIE